MREFRKQMANLNDEKSKAWKVKVDKMKAGYEKTMADKEALGQNRLEKRANKLEKMDAQRAYDDKVRQMRCEEIQLRLEDTRMKKDRVDRQEEYRRSKLQQQIDDGTERVETLLGLKNQIMIQRRGRAMAAESKGARAMSLQRRASLAGSGR